MDVTLTVMRSGNSAVVALPAAWRHARGVEIGSKLSATFSDNGALTLDKPPDADAAQRKRAFERMAAAIDSAPSVPWDDDSREADRALAAERYL